ncbi:hypothetical protein [Pseudomonas corrugata]|nr:hypothetical protein [Pseudomonas corrugata]
MRYMAVVFALFLLPASLPKAAPPDVVYGQVTPFADLPEGVRTPRAWR